MRIGVNADGEIVLSNVYNAVVIHTPQASFGVAQRDGGLEVMRDGKVVYNSLHQHRDEDGQSGSEDRAIDAQD